MYREWVHTSMKSPEEDEKVMTLSEAIVYWEKLAERYDETASRLMFTPKREATPSVERSDMPWLIVEWLRELKGLKETYGVAVERYKDLSDFLDSPLAAKTILNNRNEFKKWLERMKRYKDVFYSAQTLVEEYQQIIGEKDK